MTREGVVGPLRLAIVDDSVAIRIGLPVMLAEHTVQATFADAESLLAERPNVDVVILDLKLSGASTGPLNGVEAVRAVVAAGYRVCLYSDERRRFVLAQCLRAGAHGIVHKSDPAPVLAAALAEVNGGGQVITQSLVGLAELVDRRGGLPTLTQRQRDVLMCRARGETWASIANRLFITEGVAHEHMAAVNAKFSEHLRSATPSELQYELGLAPGDLAADK